MGRRWLTELFADSVSERGVRLVFYAFDLLHLDGQDTHSLPLIEPMPLLEPLIAGTPTATAITEVEAMAPKGPSQVFSKKRMFARLPSCLAVRRDNAAEPLPQRNVLIGAVLSNRHFASDSAPRARPRRAFRCRKGKYGHGSSGRPSLPYQ